MPEILVVDDEPGIRELMREILEEEGYEVRAAENGTAARAALDAKVPDLVLLDIWMPDVDGVTLLKEWKTQGRLTMPVVMMSGHGTVHTAVEATRLGAFDYLEKPVAYKQLLETVRKAMETRRGSPITSGSLEALGRGEAIKRLTQRLHLAASAGLPVLLLSEPGIGEDRVAQFLTPPDGAFVQVDDATLLADRPTDLLLRAKGGLVFVPDMAALSSMQQKGLALLVARRAEFATRVVAACQCPPAQMMAEGKLLRELHDQFAHAVVELPPLRARREDIPELAARMLEDACARLLIPPRVFSDAALALLATYDWPGNLAELDALAGRLALEETREAVQPANVEAILGKPAKATGPAGIELMLHLPLKDARDAFEKAYLEALLAECHWGMSRAAERAGLDRTNLYRKVKQLGIEAPAKEKA
ncbi:MAG: two component sigma-54 specific Fis family transcriptional regulator [bacterium]|nr:MAG: two component sigma-54 specific Fis family transcriptional regulator [bacterium]KAF0147994.1 MAG: two component sigma-54 specific Fis family transcriptional regulator [bacterium]KAF0167532.1 MAG: two component sigma-54 specific Fis family transcriptional regulator [bacterium]TXT20544.1 MAG: two component sigma-54 specific Fis family transcriptional regulator [bacterium]